MTKENIFFAKNFSPIKLVVAKCWDSTPRGYFTLPRHEQARPVDPLSWLAHTQAVQNTYNNPGQQVLIHQQNANYRQSMMNSTTNMSSTISSNMTGDNQRLLIRINENPWQIDIFMFFF